MENMADIICPDKKIIDFSENSLSHWSIVRWNEEKREIDWKKDVGKLLISNFMQWW